MREYATVNFFDPTLVKYDKVCTLLFLHYGEFFCEGIGKGFTLEADIIPSAFLSPSNLCTEFLHVIMINVVEVERHRNPLTFGGDRVKEIALDFTNDDER